MVLYFVCKCLAACTVLYSCVVSVNLRWICFHRNANVGCLEANFKTLNVSKLNKGRQFQHIS